jgi:hypothetical protein
MPAFAPDDPLATPQRLAGEPDRHFWEDGLGFGGFQGVMNFGSGLDEAWRKAFGAGENKVAADEVLARHGGGGNVRRNLLLAAGYVEKTDVEAVADVARSVLGDRGFPDANERRYCRTGLAARILAKKPAALLGVRAIDDFSPRRHFALCIDGHKVAPPGALHTLDWSDISARALGGLGKGKGTLLLRAIVVRPWREDVFLAFREQGRPAPNWKPDTQHTYQMGNKREWRWVRLLDGGHRAQIAGLEVERALEIASAVASALWERPREYTWARDPLTPERLAEFHEAVINPREDKLKLLEIVAEQPGFYMRPIVKVGNTDQIRVERVLEDYWDAGIGFARDPGHVLRVKVGFRHDNRKYRIEVHYPEDPLADEPTLGFGTCGVHPDVADHFASMVRDEFGVVLNPRSPADAAVRAKAWPERPGTLRASHWERMLAPTLLRPAPWEKRELGPLVTRKIVQLTSQAVFRCGSAAILRRPHGAPDGCTGWVTGEFGSVSAEEPFVQQPGDPLTCDRCNAQWGRRTERLPWQERVLVVIDPVAAWQHAVGVLAEAKGVSADRSVPGVYQWLANGEVFEVVGAEVALPDRRRVARSVGHRAAWFGASATSLGPYGDRGVSLADVLAEGRAAFQRIFDLGLVPGTPETRWLAEPPPPLYASGGPRIGSPTHKGIVQRGDDGAYLHQRRIVKGSNAMLILMLAAIQHATEEADRPDDDRSWLSAGDLAATINELLRPASGGMVDPGLIVTDQRIHTWMARLRTSIDEANVPAVTGADVIEEGGKKGVRLGPRFRLDGFSLQVEALAYKMKSPTPRGPAKR